MSVENDISTTGPLPAVITAVTGLPIGLFTATMEYGLATLACVASTVAELHAVYRAQVSKVEGAHVDQADVIPLRGGGGPRP